MADAADLKSVAFGRAGSSPAIGIDNRTRLRARPIFHVKMGFVDEMFPLILASGSPRRSQLLRDLGLEFRIEIPGVDEPLPTPGDAKTPGAFVERLAQLKARAVSSSSTNVVIAADTVVVLDEQILGKPRDEDDALDMLQRMQGRTHEVFTGVCVRRGALERCEHEKTRVTFGGFDDAFLRAYVRTGEPLDKAGSYGAQGRGALLVEKIEGDYWNVVGLPLARLRRMLLEFGVVVEARW